MNKLTIAGAVAAAMLVLPLAASAATNITFINFPNSGANATLAAGDSVDTKVTFDLTGSSELESMSLQLVDNSGNNIGMPEVCFDVADRIVAGTFTRVGNFDTTGGTEGTFGIRVRGYGLTGSGTDNNCGGTVNDNQYFSNRLTLTEGQNTGNNANNTGGTFGGGSGTGSTNALQQLIAQLTAQVSCLTSGGTWSGGSCAPHVTPPVPAMSAACTAYLQAKAGTQMNVRNDANIGLQGFLLSPLGGRQSIPWLAAGASFGYYGPQTQAAESMFLSANGGCH